MIIWVDDNIFSQRIASSLMAFLWNANLKRTQFSTGLWFSFLEHCFFSSCVCLGTFHQSKPIWWTHLFSISIFFFSLSLSHLFIEDIGSHCWFLRACCVNLYHSPVKRVFFDINLNLMTYSIRDFIVHTLNFIDQNRTVNWIDNNDNDNDDAYHYKMNTRCVCIRNSMWWNGSNNPLIEYVCIGNHPLLYRFSNILVNSIKYTFSTLNFRFKNIFMHNFHFKIVFDVRSLFS